MGVKRFVQQGVVDDDQKFAQWGIEPLSPEAMPYYARWTRQDVIGIFYLLYRMAWINCVLLIAIAVPLWIIALR